jgi:hypothetical protein
MLEGITHGVDGDRVLYPLHRNYKVEFTLPQMYQTPVKFGIARFFHQTTTPLMLLVNMVI